MPDKTVLFTLAPVFSCGGIGKGRTFFSTAGVGRSAFASILRERLGVQLPSRQGAIEFRQRPSLPSLQAIRRFGSRHPRFSVRMDLCAFVSHENEFAHFIIDETAVPSLKSRC
jgi:hypothetical protein